jgi:hypothetical protein
LTHDISSDNDERVFTLKEFEINAGWLLGDRTVKLITKILKKEYGITICEATGPNRSDVRAVLERLLGAYAASIILGELAVNR